MALAGPGGTDHVLLPSGCNADSNSSSLCESEFEPTRRKCSAPLRERTPRTPSAPPIDVASDPVSTQRTVPPDAAECDRDDRSDRHKFEPGHDNRTAIRRSSLVARM